MANQILVNYIREQVNAGYDINTIKTHLVNHGYNASEVDSSINAIYHPQVSHHVHHVSKGIVIALGIVGLVVALLIPTIYFYMSEGGQPSQLLDIKTEAITDQVNPGAKVEFNIELSNMGGGKRYDAFLKHEVVGTDIFIEETIAVETTTSKKSSIQLPNDISPRRYNLKTTASYDGKKAFSTFGFNVLGDDGEIDECSESWQCTSWNPSSCPVSGQQTRNCVDTNACGTASYMPDTTQSCTYQEDAPTTPPTDEPEEFSGLTIWEKLDSIKDTARSNPSKAKSDCETLDVESHKDECYYNIAEITLSTSDCDTIKSDRTRDKCVNNIAKTSTDSSQCELIDKESRKDSCYMNFVNSGDYTVCDKIVNTYLKDACESLRDLPNIVVS